MADYVWKTAKNLKEQKWSEMGNYALMILNRPVHTAENIVINLWNQAKYRVTVDGGTDCWLEFVSSVSNKDQIKNVYPDLTTGDFDSVKQETLEKCRKAGVKVVHTPDQDYTDFEKAFKEIVNHSGGKIESIIAVAESSGRLDQILSNLNTLFKMANTSVQLYLLNTDEITWLLSAGSHEIHVPRSLVERQAICGLLPVGNPCTVTSTGLKWNLDKTRMEFGALVSSSNTYEEKVSVEDHLVSIVTDSPFIWTMCLDL